MTISNSVQTQDYNGSLLSLSLLSGDNQTLVLSALGARSATTVIENNNSLAVGEQVRFGDGRVATVLGSGTGQPGINVLGLIVETGSKVPLVILKEPDGNIIFLYPEATPNALGIVALIVKASPKDYTFTGGIICFAEGTRILTPRGQVPVEDLQAGEEVVTEDGIFPILWLGQTVLTKATLMHNPAHRPIKIKAGVLGPGYPQRDLIVSPQHRMLVRSRVAKRMTGDDTVLIAARHLCELAGVGAVPDTGELRLFHVLLPQHRIIYAEGAPTETFFPGAQGMRTLSEANRQQIFALLGEDLYRMKPIHTVLSGRMARTLLARHVQNGIALVPLTVARDKAPDGTPVGRLPEALESYASYSKSPLETSFAAQNWQTAISANSGSMWSAP